MTRTAHRRAFTLMEIIGLLPILLALTVAAYMLASNVEDMQCRESARRHDDVRVRDVVRRIQEDAARAVDVVVEADPAAIRVPESDENASPDSQPATQPAPAATRLVLRSPGSTVTYAATPEGITRVEQSGDDPPVGYEWSLGHTRMSFQLETVGPKSRLVWVMCTTMLTFDSGPDYEWRLAAVAPVGRGDRP